jgi:ABC-2 type transport system ATP-binding protein
MVGRLHHLPKARCRERAAELLERFDLVDAAERQAKTYSGGMLRRLDLAASLVAVPAVLFLDEPTTGLDPRSRIGMWAVIRDLVSAGTTLLLTTQYLDEADELADEIIVIDHGVVIAAGTSEQLKDRVGGDVIEFTVPDRTRCGDAAGAVTGLTDTEPTVDPSTGRLSVRVGHRGSDALVQAVRALDAAHIETSGLALRRPSLDDVFLAITGHVAEEETEPQRKGRRRRADEPARVPGGEEDR